MTFHRTLTMTSVLALMAGPALADLTAEEVLADQISQIEMYGFTAEVVDQNRSGDTLSVGSLVASAMAAEGNFKVSMGGVSLIEQGDGTVKVEYPAVMPLTVSGTSEDGENFEMSISINLTGADVTASGSTEKIRYDFDIERVSVTEIEFLAPEEAKDMDMSVDVAFVNLTGFTELAAGAVRDYTAEFAAESLTFAVDANVEEGEEPGHFRFEGSSQDLTSSYSGAVGQQDLMASFAESIRNGNRTDGTAAFGPTTYTFNVDSPEGTMEGAVAVAEGDFQFKMNEDGLDYGGMNRDITLTIGGSQIPFPPMTFKLAESEGRFAMPVVPGEESQDFGLRIAMKGLEIDQMIWNMFDPAGQLAHDPATLVIDIDGEGVLSADVFDPEFADNGEVPGQLDAINVNEIELSVGGARLTGDGDFTFDNSSPMPVPSGVLNMMLTGGNGLLDTLVTMGLVPEDQAMGARMMMGLFARPGDGDDTLVSTIEFNEDGSIMANGQRIK
jgi:hypothetical protein